MPWANGSGSTREVAIWPPTASLMNFDWRISMAGISRPGPFSALLGVNRVLTVINESSLELRVAAINTTLVRRDQISFCGEESVEAVTMNSDVQALNVMTRRGRWDARVRWAALNCEARRIGTEGRDSVDLLIVTEGHLQAHDLAAPAARVQLGPLDMLRLSSRSEIKGTADAVHIRLTRPEHFVASC